jgi:chorismate mutase
MDKNKLKLARNIIDRIDKKIFGLIKKRTKIVTTLMKLKKSKKEIVDQKRINEILKKIKNKSIKAGIDQKTTNKIWKSIIWSYVDLQRRKFKKK